MRECLEEGVLQSYFDGELSSKHMEGVTSHLVSCLKCATAAHELEDEVSLLTSALAAEFDAPVPTERLRGRIEVAVAGLELGQNAIRDPLVTPRRGWLQSLSALFALTPQRTFGYASLAVVLAFGVIIGALQLQDNPSPVVDNQTNEVKTPAPAGMADNSNKAGNPVVAKNQEPIDSPTVTAELSAPRSRAVKPRSSAGNQAVAKVKLLPGERSYLKTIAALDSSIKQSSNRPMRPALQAEYERNLAVVDRALAATRNAAKKNPNDPDAVEFMFNAYQSKVDLLNTVADARLYNRP